MQNNKKINNYPKYIAGWILTIFALPFGLIYYIVNQVNKINWLIVYVVLSFSGKYIIRPNKSDGHLENWMMEFIGEKLFGDIWK